MNHLFHFGLASLIVCITAGCPGSIKMCCPTITGAESSDPWVCPAKCPNGGKTRGTVHVEFWKGSEHCQPPKEVNIFIKNLTDGVDLEPMSIKNNGTGIYDGTQELTLEKDTEFEVSVMGGDQPCWTASKKFKVDVVDKGDSCKICFSGPLTCTALGSNARSGFEPFGPGVLIDSVENLDSLMVGVSKDASNKDQLPPYRGSKAFAGIDANGQWAVWLTNETDCSIYNARPQNAQSLCLRVYLQCNCP